MTIVKTSKVKCQNVKIQMSNVMYHMSKGKSQKLNVKFEIPKNLVISVLDYNQIV